MPQFEFVEYTANPDTHVARITLNRPARLNALNDQMQREITGAILQRRIRRRYPGSHRYRIRPRVLRRRRPQRSGRLVGRKRRRLDVWQRRRSSTQFPFCPGHDSGSAPLRKAGHRDGKRCRHRSRPGFGLRLRHTHRHFAITIHVGLRTYRAVPRIRRNVVISANVGESRARRGDAFHRRFPGSG